MEKKYGNTLNKLFTVISKLGVKCDLDMSFICVVRIDYVSQSKGPIADGPKDSVSQRKFNYVMCLVKPNVAVVV